MNKTSFDEFVKRQQPAVSKEGVTEIDWNKQREEWLVYLDNLYTRIESYLASYTGSGQALLEYRQITLNEENIGSYSVRQLILKFGRQEITFTPIGTLLIAMKGRVDVHGPAGQARLFLLNKKATNARQFFHVSIGIGGTPPPDQPAESFTSIEWAWKIASPPPEVKFTDLTQEVFFDMILGVVNA